MTFCCGLLIYLNFNSASGLFCPLKGLFISQDALPPATGTEASVFKIGTLCIYIFDMVASQVKVNQIKIQVSKSQPTFKFVYLIILIIYFSLRDKEKGIENKN